MSRGRRSTTPRRNQIKCSLVDIDRLAGLVERVLELEQVIGRDAAQVRRRERREQNDGLRDT